MELLELCRKRDFLQFAIDAVANAKFVLERLQMNVRSPQLNGVFKNLIYEAYNGRFILGSGVEVRILAVFIDDLDRFLFVECADGVGADSEILLGC